MTKATPDRDRSRVELNELLDEFYKPSSEHQQLGVFRSVQSVPAPNDQLLDHDAHMTVTVEAYFKQPVDVEVHSSHRTENWYSREITLITQESKKVVQYGIVRLDVSKLEEHVWQKIEQQTSPLGRVLIEHNVLRKVELCGLWEIIAGPNLAKHMGQPVGSTLHGRTALIHCNGAAAIELLEIVNLA